MRTSEKDIDVADNPGDRPGLPPKPARRFYSLLLTLPLLAAAACRKPAPIVPPPGTSDPRILEYLAKGDEYFRRQDLYGWRMAEEFYTRVQALRADTEITDRLLLTRALRISREIDEDIAIGRSVKALESNCASPANARQSSLCDFISRYGAPRPPPSREKKAETFPTPDLQDLSINSEELQAYLQVLHSQAYGYELDKNFRVAVSEKFKSSPLFLYLNLRKVTAQPTGELEASLPDFAELFVMNGEKRMQEKRYRESRAYFNKALELIPNYTRAINGLGNIYLYVLEEYLEALQRYELALKYDATNAGALYGMGAVLHSIGRFTESNQVFDRMIATDLSRGGRLDEYNVRFYRGMGRYYQAYNSYHLSEPLEARRLVDLGKRDLPDAEQINYLSGMLYFNASQMDLARVDFERVIATGSSNCEACNYLGLIYLQTDENRAANFFMRACACVESIILHSKREIESLPSMDLEPAELISLGAKLEQRLSNLFISSAAMIKNAIMMVDLTHIQRKDMYRKMMEEILQRVIPESRSKDDQ